MMKFVIRMHREYTPETGRKWTAELTDAGGTWLAATSDYYAGDALAALACEVDRFAGD